MQASATATGSDRVVPSANPKRATPRAGRAMAASGCAVTVTLPGAPAGSVPEGPACSQPAPSLVTPAIDKLAASGLRFETCYAAPLCGPSRCLFLTGRYPFRTGLISNNSHNAVAPDRQVMIPTVMKKAGYVTASVGKWGQMSFGPGEWGFDEFLVFRGSGRYWREQAKTYTVNGQQKELPEVTMLTAVPNWTNSAPAE